MSEIERLSQDLKQSAREASSAVHRVVKKGAVNIKKDWRENAKRSAGRHARAYPYTISFDISREGSPVSTAVIGPDKEKKQGPLGNLIEFGSVNNSPNNDGGRALQVEEPKFEQALKDEVDLL